MRTICDIAYTRNLNLAMDLYLPDAENFDTVVFFHGGGLEAGTRKDYAQWMEGTLEKGLGFVSVDYRMYPTAHFPEYLLDAANAVAYVQKHIGEYRGSGKIVLAGSSAGAYIVMMLTMNPAYLRNAGADEKQIIACVSDSAQMGTHFNVLREYGTDSRALRITEAAPMFYTDVRKIPYPLMLIAYEDDIPCRLEENALFYRNVLRFDANAPVLFEVLPGKHTSGCNVRSEADGEYPCIRLMTEILQRANEA